MLICVWNWNHRPQTRTDLKVFYNYIFYITSYWKGIPPDGWGSECSLPYRKQQQETVLFWQQGLNKQFFSITSSLFIPLPYFILLPCQDVQSGMVYHVRSLSGYFSAKFKCMSGLCWKLEHGQSDWGSTAICLILRMEWRAWSCFHVSTSYVLYFYTILQLTMVCFFHTPVCSLLSFIGKQKHREWGQVF